MSSCNQTSHEYIYYRNGAIKSDIEIVNGKKNGIVLDYYQDGKLKAKSNWKNNEIIGEIENYARQGYLQSKILMNNSVIQEAYYYSSKGKLLAIEKYDSSGKILSGERFKEDGTRDSMAYQYMKFAHHSDTLELGKSFLLQMKTLNVYDDIYKNGVLIISSEFVSRADEITQVKDTIQIIKATNTFEYEYVVVPKKAGQDTIKGQFIFKKLIGEDIEILSELVKFPYYVK